MKNACFGFLNAEVSLRAQRCKTNRTAHVGIYDKWRRSPLYMAFETCSMKGPSLELAEQLLFPGALQQASWEGVTVLQRGLFFEQVQN